MLILSRKPGDAILIDGGIRVVVVQSDRGGVRLGIEAPRDVSILRAEIVDQVTAQNTKAADASAALAALAQAGSPFAPRRAVAQADGEITLP
jgi:carbon storage regulator